MSKKLVRSRWIENNGNIFEQTYPPGTLQVKMENLVENGPPSGGVQHLVTASFRLIKIDDDGVYIYFECNDLMRDEK